MSCDTGVQTEVYR